MATMTDEQTTQQHAPASQDSKSKVSEGQNQKGSNEKAQQNSDDQPEKGKEDEEQGEEKKKEEKPMSPAKKARIIVLGAFVVLLLTVGIVLWFLHASTYEDTDDAQVNGHLNNVAARIEGTVTGVYVENNHNVKAGQPLVDLDPKDNQVAYDQANARLLQARLNAQAIAPNLSITKTSTRADIASGIADVASAQAMGAGAEHDVAVAEAHLRQSEANNLRAQNDLARYKVLVEKDEVSSSNTISIWRAPALNRRPSKPIKPPFHLPSKLLPSASPSSVNSRLAWHKPPPMAPDRRQSARQTSGIRKLGLLSRSLRLNGTNST